MIFPFTHDHATVRRLPWVTFSIIAVCLLVQLWAGGRSQLVRSSGESFQTAIDYLLDHPELTPDRRLVPPEIAPRLVEELRGEEPRGATGPGKQATLDAHTDAWLATLDEQPYWTVGLVPARFQLTDVVTARFLHEGWFHLFINMFFLYLAGPLVEDRWGPGVFAAFVLIGGTVSALSFVLHYPDLFRPLFGSGGTVAAVMGACVLAYSRARIQCFYFFGVFCFGTFTAPAWLILPLWFLGSLFVALASDAAVPGGYGGGIERWPHVWGFLFGLAVALVLRATGAEERLRWAGEGEVPEPAESLVFDEPEAAWLELGEASRRPGATTAVLEAYWELARRLRRPLEALPVAWRLIRDELRRGDFERAHVLWLEVRDELPDGSTDPHAGVRLAEALEGEGRWEDALAVLLDAAPRFGPRTPLGTTMKAIQIADRLGQRELHRTFVNVALAQPNLPAELREELEHQRPLW